MQLLCIFCYKTYTKTMGNKVLKYDYVCITMDQRMLTFLPEGITYPEDYIHERTISNYNIVTIENTSIECLIDQYKSTHRYSFLLQNSYVVAIDMQERRWFMFNYSLICTVHSMILRGQRFNDLLLTAGYSILNKQNPKLPVFVTGDADRATLVNILNHRDYQRTEYTDGIEYIDLDVTTDSLHMDLVLGLVNNIPWKSYFYLVATKDGVRLCNAEVILDIVPMGTSMSLGYNEDDFFNNLQPVLYAICQFDEILPPGILTSYDETESV